MCGSEINCIMRRKGERLRIQLVSPFVNVLLQTALKRTCTSNSIRLNMRRSIPLARLVVYQQD